jgi:uncharacterized protein
MQDTFDQDKRKLLSALSHGSIFLSALLISVAVPIGILFVSDDTVVKANAKEALNFHLNVWLYGAIIGALSFITLGLAGFILGPIWFALHWGLTIWAVYQCLNTPDRSVHYPFIFRLL